jgi:hypothetical protein
MLTLVILSIMLGAVYGVFLGTLSSKKYCDEVKDAGHRAQAILLLLRRDVEGMVDLGSGRVSLEGVDGSEGGGDADRLGFVTTSDTRTGQEKYDVNEVSYFLMASEADDEDGTVFQTLYRREDPGMDSDPFADGVEEVLDDRISSFDVQYLGSDGAWASSWTGEALPAALRVTLVLNREVSEGGSETRDYTYITFFPVAGR